MDKYVDKPCPKTSKATLNRTLWNNLSFFKVATHLNMVISVVMNINKSVKLRFLCNVQVCTAFYAFGQGLSCILLHLDEKKFPAKQIS